MVRRPPRRLAAAGDRWVEAIRPSVRRVGTIPGARSRPEGVAVVEATVEADSRDATRLEGAAAVVLEGRTGLVVAHRLRQAAAADRILVMDSGRIVESGAHDTLLSGAGTTRGSGRPGGEHVHRRLRADDPAARPMVAGLGSRCMAQFRITTAARMMGVGDEAVRRWIGDGTLPASIDVANRKLVEGADLATVARDRHGANPEDRSAANRLVGLVTSVVSDLVMARVEMQCGPLRVVSVMSSEAARELRLEPGSVAVAVVNSTDVIVETSPCP